MNLNLPPAANVAEVSVFGPGFGECIVLHVGEGEWVVVDSCVDARSGRPVAVDYFEQLGVDIAKNVSLVIATHWHDDHIGGFGELFEASQSARFACSMAMRCQEWLTLLEIYSGYLQAGGSGVDELGRALRELKRRAKQDEVVAPDFCVRNRNLRDRDGPLVAKIDCLAPSDAAVGVMQGRISKELLPGINGRRLRVPSLSENDGSVVLAVSVGSSASVLLGADLLERGRPGLGWQVILDDYPQHWQRFGGFKIPHHGSITGYHPEAWGRLMSPGGWAAITPFNRQKIPLPNFDDCVRMLNMTENAFITAPPGLNKLKHHDPAVQRTLQEALVGIGPEPGKQGHIRFRKNADRPLEEWTVELFGNAVPLKSLV